MVKADDIKVALACLFPTVDPIWMMMHTCSRFGIDPYLYGRNETYGGWVDIKVKKLKDAALKVLEMGHSHLLYIDARDAWFLTGLDEIADKYNAMGCPPLLLSAQHLKFCGGYGEWYDQVPWDDSLAFPYIGTPGQLCDARKLAEVLTYMDSHYSGLPDDDPPWWLSYMRDFPGQVKLDHMCSIFFNAGDCSAGYWDVEDGRAINKVTGERPCTIHFNGGSSDALKGKWEGLESQWRKFGYTNNPPWEAA